MQQYPDIDTVAIGRFDGLHRGHMALAAHLGPHGALLVIDTLTGDLTPAALLSRFTDIPYVRLAFESIRHLSPVEFVTLLGEIFPSLRRVVVGEDFRFGHGRVGDTSTLAELFTGETVIVPELMDSGEPIRSSRIRHHICMGDMARANVLLGREYRVFARAVSESTLLAEPFLLPLPWDYPVLLRDGTDSYDTVARVTDACLLACERAGLVPWREYSLVFRSVAE